MGAYLSIVLTALFYVSILLLQLHKERKGKVQYKPAVTVLIYTAEQTISACMQKKQQQTVKAVSCCIKEGKAQYKPVVMVLN